MTVKECYEQMHGDYQDMLERVGTDGLVERFMLKYTDEKTMDTLRAAVNAGDIEASFNAAHTLKGIVANLGFSGMLKAVHDLTEQLRPRTEAADSSLMQKVEEEYKLVIDTIELYRNSKQ